MAPVAASASRVRANRDDAGAWSLGSPPAAPVGNLLAWREFIWGAIAGAFGEGIMHPVDTLKTRIQSQTVISGTMAQKNLFQMARVVWASDGLQGFYRGVVPGITGSLATGATYFGVIEFTKKWLEEVNPKLNGHVAHFVSGAVGDTLGSFVYVPCEVMKQRMQVQGSLKSWSSRQALSRNPGGQMYGYYTGMIQAGHSIWKEQGLKGLYAGYWSTLARDVPFAGLMITFYEGLKELSCYGKKRFVGQHDTDVSNSFEGLLLGGLAGGMSAYLTTPLDVIKTRMQVQGSVVRYTGWHDALQKIWHSEGLSGLFKGSIPRIMWYVPASALTFMAVEFLRDRFNDKIKGGIEDVTGLPIDKINDKIHEAA